jgi:hypothetical protein
MATGNPVTVTTAWTLVYSSNASGDFNGAIQSVSGGQVSCRIAASLPSAGDGGFVVDGQPVNISLLSANSDKLYARSQIGSAGVVLAYSLPGTPANPIPVISGKAVSVTATSLASQVATSYAAGTCIGTLYEFPAFFTDGVDSGVIQKLLAGFDSASLTATIDAYVFKSNPSGSTITDGAAFVLAAADIDKLSTIIQLTPRGVLGASGISTVYEASDIWRPASGTTAGKLYVVLTPESALTLTTLDLLGFKIGGSRD